MARLVALVTYSETRLPFLLMSAVLKTQAKSAVGSVTLVVGLTHWVGTVGASLRLSLGLDLELFGVLGEGLGLVLGLVGVVGESLGLFVCLSHQLRALP